MFERRKSGHLSEMKNNPFERITWIFPSFQKLFLMLWHHRVLFMSQCEWILYESGHKFFMKASQILYVFVLLNIERLEAGKNFNVV